MIFDPDCSIEFCGMRLRLDAAFFVEPAVQQALLRSLARTIAASRHDAAVKARALALLADQMELQRQPADAAAVRRVVRQLGPARALARDRCVARALALLEEMPQRENTSAAGARARGPRG